jgi:phosphatidylserine/phosphatidylglycerophosphate/cardiolipin synthase-like enzyme
VNKNLLLSLLSDSTGSVTAYFSYPGRYIEEEKKRNVLQAILTLIENAKFSLKVYAYSLNHPKIISALKEASGRGVKVEIVGDKDQNYDLVKASGFPIKVWKQSGLHHIKVILADNKTLFTGTGNFSRYGLTNDWNGYIQLDVESLNRSRTLEFLNENLTLPILDTNGISFIGSPDNGFLSQDLLLEKVESAKVSIDYLIFDHYDAVLSHALKKATERGVQVTGVYDSPVDDEGVYLADNFYGLSSGIYKDGNEDIEETQSFPEGGLLHHKSMIVDGKVLLSGSFNYSSNARDSNREILFKTENFYLVSEFQKEFNRVRDKSYQIPKNRFHSFADKKTLDSSALRGDTLCLPDNINSPIVELGSGVWKTYLYYPKVKSSKCFFISSYESISSGLTHGTKSDFLSLDGLWDSFQVYDRNSNISYHFNSTSPHPIFHSGKIMILKNPRYLSFTSSRIYFEMKENLPIATKDIHVWIPGKNIRSSKVEQPLATDLGYTAIIPTVSSERFYAGVFIDTPDAIYFFCLQERTKSNRDSFDFLIRQIYLDSDRTTPQETSCVRND